jgi:hypothetical protein
MAGPGFARIPFLPPRSPSVNIRLMEDFFSKLGREVLARWKKRNFCLADFPKIATDILKEKPPSDHVDLETLISDFLFNDEQPFQTQSGFGQPELVVYDNPRFYIQVLFWLDGTTDIHQHEFSGAFHVMRGSSIHADFDFEKPQAISTHFRVGDLRMTGIELLDTGCTVPIVSGRAHIHSLFHLDMPSVSVVIRTHHDPGTGPQFTYLPPHVAVDPVPHDALTMRRMQLLDALERLGDPSYPDLLRAMLAELDFERGFFILQNGMGHLQEMDEWKATLKVFEKKHGANGRRVAPVLEEILRRDALMAMRATITAVEHRFFLALLLNAPTRKDILRLVSQRYPGDAVETIMGWASELGDVDGFSTGILDAEFPEAVDVPEEEQAEVFLAVLRYVLKGSKGRLKAGRRMLSAADMEAFRAAMACSALRPMVV